MGQQEPVRIVDLWDVRLRMATVRFGVWVTIAVCSVGGGYCLFTWQHPNRSLMLVLLGAALLSGLAIGLLDAERIVRRDRKSVV